MTVARLIREDIETILKQSQNEDIGPSRSMTPERAAKMIADKIRYTPNLTIPAIQHYVEKYLSMVGMFPKDVKVLTALVHSELEAAAP